MRLLLLFMLCTKKGEKCFNTVSLCVCFRLSQFHWNFCPKVKNRNNRGWWKIQWVPFLFVFWDCWWGTGAFFRFTIFWVFWETCGAKGRRVYGWFREVCVDNCKWHQKDWDFSAVCHFPSMAQYWWSLALSIIFRKVWLFTTF